MRPILKMAAKKRKNPRVKSQQPTLMVHPRKRSPGEFIIDFSRCILHARHSELELENLVHKFNLAYTIRPAIGFKSIYFAPILKRD